MSRFLSYILAGLLAAAILISAWAFVLSRTLGSATFLDKHAQQTQFYPKLAAALPDAGIDPAIMSEQVKAFLPGFIAYLTKGGPAPTIEINGAALPVTLGPIDSNVQSTFKAIEPVGMFAPLIAIGLILLMIVVLRGSRLPTIARGAIQAAISLALSGAIVWMAPALIVQAFNKPESLALVPVVEPFLVSVFHDIALQLLAIAAALTVIYVVLRLVHGAGRFKAKFIKPKRPKEPVAPPPPQQPRFN